MLYPVELEKPIFHTKIGKQNDAPQNVEILFTARSIFFIVSVRVFGGTNSEIATLNSNPMVGILTLHKCYILVQTGAQNIQI